MAIDDDRQRANLEAAAAAVREMTGRLRKTQAQVQRLGFIARGFVEKDVSGSTGRSLADWAKAGDALGAALAAAPADPQSQARAGALLAAERPRLATLRAYLERAPEKVSKVPGAVLKPAQRAEFLQEMSEQVAAVQSLEQHLARIAASLPAAG
ncbi:MAG: hypothetical protein ACRDIE_06860 [Chloroflexota bacterium]